jgi:hypothetical protein
VEQLAHVLPNALNPELGRHLEAGLAAHSVPPHGAQYTVCRDEKSAGQLPPLAETGPWFLVASATVQFDFTRRGFGEHSFRAACLDMGSYGRFVHV